jgi:4-diphosphocytidyl-2-C-methyl-D-erythritol kinase
MLLRAAVPAKINRELRVGQLREDGYHEILSRIVSIDFCDLIEVGPGVGRLEFTCEGEAPSDDTNLVVRAARALADHLGRPLDARLRLEKRVPPGSGLGGGSADAAATLVLLSRLWEAELPLSELTSLAAGLGSDVPFFLHGGEATVTGRGEVVQPLPDEPAVDILLLIPPFSVSTAGIYAELHRRRVSGAALPRKLDIEKSRRFLGPNDLASAVLETYPGMKLFLESASELAAESGISGSGSTIVLRGANAETSAKLARRHPDALLISCRTLSRDEYRSRASFSGGR